VHEVHPVDDAHRAGGQEVARHHAHAGAGHGGVGQALAEGGFDLVAQLAGGLLRAVQRDGVGHAHAVVVARLLALEAQLFIHLRAKAVHQHDLHAHGLDQRQILHDALQLAGGDGFARDAHHESLVAEFVDVRGHRPEPGNEGEIENRGHGGCRQRERERVLSAGNAQRAAGLRGSKGPHPGECEPIQPRV